MSTRIAEAVPELMQRFGVPGVAVGILRDGETDVACFGVTSVEDPLPVHDETFFQIGSTTKTMTGTVAVRLAADGKLSLDEPIRSYVPELRLADEDVAQRVTLRHVFTHSAGWLGDYFENTGRGDGALARAVAKLADLPQLTPLGEEWHYLNSGFYAAGRVIEVITGETFETAVRRLLWDPLGMTMSHWFAEEVIARRVAVGHYVRDDAPEVVRQWALHRSAHPAGGAISTVRDQLRYAAFHLGDGTGVDGSAVVPREELERMREPTGPRGAVGLTWWIREADGVRIVSHGGTTAGQTSAFVLVPERGFGVTVLTNSSRGSALHRHVVRLALREHCGIDDADPAHRAAAPGELEPFVGRWMIARSMLEITRDGDDVTLAAAPRPGVAPPPNGWPPYPPPARCAMVNADELIVLDGPSAGARAQLVRDAHGDVVWLRFGLRLYAPESRAERYPAFGSGLVS